MRKEESMQEMPERAILKRPKGLVLTMNLVR